MEVSSEHPEENSSAVLKNTKRILYAEANVTDGDVCNSDIDINDGSDSATSIKDDGADSESNCDVDEHSDMMMMSEEGESPQKSPPKMNPVSFDSRNVKMIISSSSLNTVPEVNSCGALSSGQVSVDQ